MEEEQKPEARRESKWVSRQKGTKRKDAVTRSQGSARERSQRWAPRGAGPQGAPGAERGSGRPEGVGRGGNTQRSRAGRRGPGGRAAGREARG